MKVEVMGNAKTDLTNTPRDLTPEETTQITAIGRIAAVKLYREMTNATLAVALKNVDRIQLAGLAKVNEFSQANRDLSNAFFSRRKK
jgi:hypothetical protein